MQHDNTNSDSNSSINITKIMKQFDTHLRPSGSPVSAPPAPSSVKPSISLRRSLAVAVAALGLAHHEAVLDARGRAWVHVAAAAGVN